MGAACVAPLVCALALCGCVAPSRAAAADADSVATPAPPPPAQDTTRVAPAPGAAVAFPGVRVRRWQVGLLRPDRLQHASLSMTLALGVGVATRHSTAGAVVSVACGLAKELWDTRTTGFDVVDLVADVTGAAVGTYASRAIEY